jgi:serine/threonine protein kinase/tetratricopeptide (TPR) repeat protein
MTERTIFLGVLAIDDPAERHAYLDRACGGNAALRSQVEDLLKAHAESGDFMGQSAPALVAIDDAADAERPGALIGPYKLLELIGEGGMGVVYHAEQQGALRRRVALKLIKPGMDSKQVIGRFEAERQALALMDHPNIAKVFDAGMSETGRPYFVMELVKGKPITEYCDRHRLPTRQRLELFLDVCHAVQHAHQKGIIHRDLKPSNVLVEIHDVRPVVKIIDFGVAKAIGQQLTDKTLFTGLVQLIGTPMYMSPEQAGLSSLDVDTRSDVYSLGVLLYELLTGTTPFESETLKKAGYDEMRRIIREEEPPKPSTRLSTLQNAALSTIAERRGLESEKLTVQVKGDLDWMVMKALEKDRNRRYESASALAADVQRYLHDEEVEACPPSAGYRLRKYMRRNRRVLAMVGVVAASLIAATAVSIWQATRATMAQHQAEADRKQAETDRDRAKTAESNAQTNLERAKEAEKRATTEAAIAKAVNDFFQEDVLRQASSAPPPDHDFAGDPYLTVKEALDRVEARIGQRFQNQPLVEAAIRMAIGEAYNGVTDPGRAVPHFEQAFAIRKAHLGPADPKTLQSKQALSGAYLWVGRHSESIALLQQLLEERITRLGPDHAEVLECMTRLADAYRWASHLDTSRRLDEEVLEKRLRLFGPTHRATLGIMTQLGDVHEAAGRFEEAIGLNAKCLEVLKAQKESESEWAHFIRIQIARSCMRVGKFGQADRLLREVCQFYQNREDSHSRRVRLATSGGWLALSLVLQEQYAEAEPIAREAAGLYAKYAPNQARRFYYEGILGAALLGQKKYTEAEPILLQAYQGMKRWERMSPTVISGLTEVGGWIVQLYEATNQPEKAREWRETLKPKPPDAASTSAKVIRERDMKN